MEQQRSLEWYKSRLGFITGSRLGEIMKESRTKGEFFSVTAMNYLYQLAAERTMDKDFIENDVMFSSYIDQVAVSSKAMQWGVEHEADARTYFAAMFDVKVDECPSFQHPTIPFFSSSPDGIFTDKDGERCTLEIKCPTQAVFMRYKEAFDVPLSTEEASEALKSINPVYYYQCIAHIMCTGSARTYFAVYCPFQETPLIYTFINRSEEEISNIESRVFEANGRIARIIEPAI